MESKILNFPEAMSVAKLLVDLDVDWMFFDTSLTYQDFIDLLIDTVSDEQLMEILYRFVGEKSKEIPVSELLSTLLESFGVNRVQDLITQYRKNWTD